MDDIHEQVHDTFPTLRFKYAFVENVSNRASMLFRLGAGGWISFRYQVKADVILAAYLALLQRDSDPEFALFSDFMAMGRMIDPERCARITWLAALWSQYLSIGSSVSMLLELTKAALIIYAKIGHCGSLNLSLREHDVILGNFIRAGLALVDARVRDQTQRDILGSLLIEDEDRRIRVTALSTPSPL